MQIWEDERGGQDTAGPCRAITCYPGCEQVPNVHIAVQELKLPMKRLNISQTPSMDTEVFRDAYSSHSRAGFKIIYHDEAGQSEATRPFAANLCR